ncbi:MAG: hypothetical protein ACRCWF_17765 [Beijerinckiaceae bacterium]
MARFRFSGAAVASASSLATLLVATAVSAAEPVTVNYTMALAGLPIGSATLVLTPNGTTTLVAVVGKAGGPFEIGRMSASAVVGPGQVTAKSDSGSGKNASSATLVSRGAPGSSNFSYTGQTNRGPGKVAMILSGGRPTSLDVAIPDNPKAVRAPLTDSHKTGVVDPLSVLSLLVQPGGTMRPEGICGRNHAVFTGQARFNLQGGNATDANVRGLPEGWSAVSCRVTYTPVAGHRIDKNINAAQVRTANLVFAKSPAGDKNVLWSLSVPGSFGSFSLAANGVK